MTPELEVIKSRLEAATPGPWAWTRMSNSLQVYGSKAGDVTSGEWICECATEDDQALIANAPTDLARLIRALELADAALAQCQHHAGWATAQESAYDARNCASQALNAAREARAAMREALGVGGE